MNKQRFFYILLTLLLLLPLVTACGGGEPAAAEAGDDVAAAGEDTAAVSAGDPAAGEELYNQVCIACHGPGGQGIEGLGKPFTTSEFVRTHSDAELLEFVKTGRPMSDPLNTTGVDMPPKGGNPALTDEQILDVIAYIRSLQQ